MQASPAGDQVQSLWSLQGGVGVGGSHDVSSSTGSALLCVIPGLSELQATEPSHVLGCSGTIQESFFSRAGLMAVPVYRGALMCHTFPRVRFRCLRSHQILCQIHKLLACAVCCFLFESFFPHSSSTRLTVKGFKAWK